MGKLSAALQALRHGASLADPAGWKRRQNTVNALAGLIGALLAFYPMDVSADDVAAIAGGIAAVLGLLNAYLTTASSDKVGLRNRRPPVDRPSDSADGHRSDVPRIEP